MQNLSNQEVQRSELPTLAEGWLDPIGKVLSENDRDFYFNLVPENIRRGYAEGLKRVVRWSNHLSSDTSEEVIESIRKANSLRPDENRIKLKYIRAGFKETDLEHVQELEVWIREIEENYPELIKEVTDDNELNNIYLKLTLGIHDGGEIISKDLSRSDENFHKEKGRRHKKVEARAAKYLINRFLGPEEAKLIYGLYHRFELRQPDDKMAMLGHLLDKGQASQNVAKHVFPFNIDNRDYDVNAHIQSSQGITLEFAERLNEQLQSKIAKLCLKDLVEKKVVNYFDQLEIPKINLYRALVRAKYSKVFACTQW